MEKDAQQDSPFYNSLEDGDALPKFRSRRVPVPDHVDSRQIANLLNPARGIREAMQRRGITPCDHRKANRAAISHLSARSQAMKQLANEPEPPPVKPPRLVLTQPPRPAAKSGETDFLTKNFKEAGMKRAPPTKPKQQREGSNGNSSNFGKVPAYLIRRKMELALDAEKKLMEEEAKSMPPGFVLMPDEEKSEVLKTLQHNKVELEKKLRVMPLVIETPSLLRTKTEMDTQLRETEDAIKRFSRPKVYISLEDL